MFAMFSRFGQLMGFIQSFAGTNQEGSEVSPQHMTWYDRLLASMMRLVRPLIIFGFFGLCLLGWFYPESTATFGRAMKEIPEFLQWTLLVIVLSVAAPKMIQSSRKGGYGGYNGIDTINVMNIGKPLEGGRPEGSAKPPMEKE